MAEIDWNSDEILQPEALPVEDFCRRKGLPAMPPAEDGRLHLFVAAKALESLNHYLASDLSREHGGVLVGRPYQAPGLEEGQGSYYVDVEAAIPAFETEGSAVHLQFTAESWERISGIIEESFPELVIVGWYHSHPGLGVFMSGTDRASQRAFYPHPWSLALVVDPVVRLAGWFSGPECDLLARHQVTLYGEAAAPLPAAQAESEPGSASPGLAWFLPLALLLLGFVLGWLIPLGKSRL